MYFGDIPFAKGTYGLIIEPVQYTNIVKTVMPAWEKFADIAHRVQADDTALGGVFRLLSCSYLLQRILEDLAMYFIIFINWPAFHRVSATITRM